jgi:hypothetical protein
MVKVLAAEKVLQKKSGRPSKLSLEPVFLTKSAITNPRSFTE